MCLLTSWFVKIVVLTFYVFILSQLLHAQRHRTIYQKIQQEPAYSGFSALIRNNRVAKLNMHFDNLTLFVPSNSAFKNYPEEFRSEIAFYHMSFEVKTLERLRTTKWMRSAVADFPPLWISRDGRDIYVNNAKILQDKSGLVALRRSGDIDKQQVLHAIDEVLDPIIPSPRFQPTAYDFLSSAQNWNLDSSKTVTSFFHKVQESNLAEAYQQKGGHTFFIPVDTGIDPHEFKMINKNTICGHIVPNLVLFARPAEKNFLYDTMASDRSTYILVSFEEKDDKLYVRGLAGGDLGNGNGEEGEFVSEIVFPNIPVKNGVVHLVSQPLGIFDRTLRPFPYLSVLDKFTNDLELTMFYDMGVKTGFNEKLKEEGGKFTFFVPKDASWIETKKQDLEPVEDDLDILNSHLIVSDTPYSMERLFALSRANNFTDIELNTEAGPVRFTVLKLDRDFYIKWGKRYIRVVRPDYECTNGIVHVLAGPLTRFKEAGERGGDAPGEIRFAFNGNLYNTSSAVQGYWKVLGNVWSNIF